MVSEQLLAVLPFLLPQQGSCGLEESHCPSLSKNLLLNSAPLHCNSWLSARPDIDHQQGTLVSRWIILQLSMVPVKPPKNSPQGLVVASASVTTHQVHRPSTLGPPVAVVNLKSLTSNPSLLILQNCFLKLVVGLPFAGHTREEEGYCRH